MANNFVIRKGLIVSGSDIQPLTIQGTSGQLFNIASSSQGNIFSVNNISGIPLLKVSGSKITLGVIGYSGSRATTFVTGSTNQLSKISFARVTGSINLTNLQVNNYWIRNIGEINEEEWSYGTATIVQGIASPIKRSLQYSAEGFLTSASGDSSHAEGFLTSASGYASHAEGSSTITLQQYSHAEGSSTYAMGVGSHAEGVGGIRATFYYQDSISQQLLPTPYCHTQGRDTIAQGKYSSVQGIYNIPTYSTSSFIVGNGFEIDQSQYEIANLIHAYGTGSNGIVEIGGSLKVTGEIVGSYNTSISSQTVATYALQNTDAGQQFLFKNNCDITLPSGLTPGFSTTITTLNTVVYILTGSGVTLINNKGTTLPMKSSVTIVNTGTANEYLVLGDL